MTTYQFSFTDSQISILRTSLDTRINRIDDMIRIFSDSPEDSGSVWMVARYNEERAEAEGLLQELTNATSFLPTA